jgi:peptidoglycan L-alanyl-D-glutamate endopeptidase CwlK
MPWVLSDASLRRLAGVHPHLEDLILEASRTGEVQFDVVEGLRTLERQRQLVAEKKSKTMNSRHLTGHAVDLVPLTLGKQDWRWPGFYPLAAFMKSVAASRNQPIEWGGDWRKFKDGPHWQLPWAIYPND